MDRFGPLLEKAGRISEEPEVVRRATKYRLGQTDHVWAANRLAKVFPLPLGIRRLRCSQKRRVRTAVATQQAVARVVFEEHQGGLVGIADEPVLSGHPRSSLPVHRLLHVLDVRETLPL
jgi:hypothetical protein